jgi:hypothetical protein
MVEIVFRGKYRLIDARMIRKKCYFQKYDRVNPYAKNAYIQEINRANWVNYNLYTCVLFLMINPDTNACSLHCRVL